MKHPDLQKMAELFAISAEFGEFLQQRAKNPVDGTMVLLIALGRLFAREGYADFSREAAWAFLMDEETGKYIFDWAYDEERAKGHTGVPRPKVGRA